ncbi:hypothetical protein FGB62_159g00 [Gracilaria domingensis]|nr:hypothetical protein FGB62_159g00 [Gracilaria domingensis]
MRYSENKVGHAKFLEGGAVISKMKNYFEVRKDHLEYPSLKITLTVGSVRGTDGAGSSKRRGTSGARNDKEIGTSTRVHREELGKGSKKDVGKHLSADFEQRGKDCPREATRDLCLDMVGDKIEGKPLADGAKPDRLMSSQTIVEDLPGYLYEVMKESYSYGVHLRMHIPCVRQYRFTTRVRYMKQKQYPKGTGCKAGIVAKLFTDIRSWVVMGEISHNHKRASMSNKAINMRVSAIRNSIKKCSPKTLQIPFFHFTAKNAQRAKQLGKQKSGLQELPQSKRREVTIISDCDEDFMKVTPRLSPHPTAPRIIELNSLRGTNEGNDVQDVMEVNEEILDEGRECDEPDDCLKL